MKTFTLSILTLAIAVGMFKVNSREKLDKAYKDRRIQILNHIKDEMQSWNDRLKEVELDYINSQIEALENGIEIERSPVGK